MRKLSRLSKRQILNLRELSGLPDSKIDISDIHEWTVEDFARSVPLSSLYKPRKIQITTRIDADVVEWLKSDRSPYQSRLNSILRIAMLSAIKKASKAHSRGSFARTFTATAKRAVRKTALKLAYRNKKVPMRKR